LEIGNRKPESSPANAIRSALDVRSRICIWIILIGLANFLAYSLTYAFFGGGAVYGSVHRAAKDKLIYRLDSGVAVSRGVFIYSGIHSISIWPTVGAIMLAMLTLAKDRVISSMRSTIVRGRTLLTILATAIGMIVAVMMVWFILHFCASLRSPFPPEPQPAASQAVRLAR
jgi:hypothetical protein